MNEPYFITAKDLAARGKQAIPPELVSTEHLVYSSPATLAFNSPGAQGFGVKRAGLSVPESVMLLVAPRCCGRNTSALAGPGGFGDRFFYLLLDDTDIVTGRHLMRIPEAVQEVCASCGKKPSAVMICITCVDALLGTDMERVCRKASEAAKVPVVPCYMYALTREGRLPPMAAVRKSVYSLLEPKKKRPDAVNLLGYFSPLRENCELYELLRQAGIHAVREISRCKTFAEYQDMAEANFNLILHPEARYAALDMEKRLGIPSIELTRLYQIDKIHRQYQLLAQAAGLRFDDTPYLETAQRAQDIFREKFGCRTFSIGEWLNGNPFELALALLRAGFCVKEIFGTVGDANFIYVRRLAELSPDTRIYSNLSPTMCCWKETEEKPDLVLGQDAMYYHPSVPGLKWNEESQPFGFEGVATLFRSLSNLLEGGPA